MYVHKSLFQIELLRLRIGTARINPLWLVGPIVTNTEKEYVSNGAMIIGWLTKNMFQEAATRQKMLSGASWLVWLDTNGWRWREFMGASHTKKQ